MTLLAIGLYLLIISPVLWAGWKMWVNHIYHKKYHQETDEIMADTDARSRLERLMALGGPNPPY